MRQNQKLALAVAGIAGAGGLGYWIYQQTRPKTPPIPVSLFQATNHQYSVDYTAAKGPAMGLRGLNPNSSTTE